LPAGFRREFGASMRLTFADLCAATVRARGVRGLAPVLAYAVADLAGGAVREWAAALLARERWHRSVAAGVCVLAGLLVLYSQLRYPANLLRVDYLLEYLLLLALLAALADGFARSRALSPSAVACALATLPGWLVVVRFPLAGSGFVAALVLAGAAREVCRGARWHAGIRAGVTSGVLAGVTVLSVSVAGGIFDMGRLLQDATYRAEYLHSGQTDPAAYIIGERICGSALLALACAAAGAFLGLAAAGVRGLRS
jgi:hypothetical protein